MGGIGVWDKKHREKEDTGVDTQGLLGKEPFAPNSKNAAGELL